MPKASKTSSSHHRNSSLSAASLAATASRSSTWSAEADETLIQARAKGMNWNQIAPKYFPSKSPNACRKRHERLMERKNAEQWDGAKLEYFATMYMEYRMQTWVPLANQLGEKWELVEAKCMEKGVKNLAQVYRAAQKKANDSSGISLSGYSSYSQPPKRVNSIQSILQNPNVGYPHQQY